MIKYRVNRLDGSTDFIDEQSAQNYFDSIDNGVSIVIIDEPDSVYIEPENIIVPRWRVKFILQQMDLLGAIDSLLSQLPEPNKTLALLAWNECVDLESQSPTVKFIQQSLSLTDEQVVEIFMNAKNIIV